MWVVFLRGGDLPRGQTKRGLNGRTLMSTIYHFVSNFFIFRVFRWVTPIRQSGVSTDDAIVADRTDGGTCLYLSTVPE